MKHKMDFDQHSVVSAALEFIDGIIDSIESGNKVVGSLMYLSKAFNTVSHVTLLNKLSAIGLSAHTLTCFRSYLSNRKAFYHVIICKW